MNSGGDIPLGEMTVGEEAEKLFTFFTMCLTLSSEDPGTSYCWGRKKKTLLDPSVWSDKPVPVSTKTVVVVWICYTG